MHQVQIEIDLTSMININKCKVIHHPFAISLNQSNAIMFEMFEVMTLGDEIV